jgi:site-specific DNA-methyltransferase (adenine-specific)
MNKVLFSSCSVHWPTPEGLYKQLNEEFKFDFDPCPLFAQFDGLIVEWGMSSFVNPPYGRQLYSWIQKGYEESCAGKRIVFLLPARTDTKWFHDYCLKANEVRFIKGRLKFGNAKNSAPFPSMIVVFDGKSDHSKVEPSESKWFLKWRTIT